MNRTKTAVLTLAVSAALALGGCNSSKKITDPAEPTFSLALFAAASNVITNQYFPLTPGMVYTYRTGGSGLEIGIVEVLDEVRIVAGVRCVVVHDRVFEDDLLLEDTKDWFAQDARGNVWYMGEEVTNFEYDEDGNEISTNNDGAWEAGVDGAVAGIYMKATLTVGDKYMQELAPGVAEDAGEIVALNVLVTLMNGTTYRCLKTKDTNALEPGVVEFKYYAPGVGVVREEKDDLSDFNELQGWFDLTDATLPDISTATFTNPTAVTNANLAFFADTGRAFVDTDEDEAETIVVEVQEATRIVDGIECLVVRDRVFVGDLIVEDTFDWYAQDDNGNVWYMGEDVTNFEYDEEGNEIGTNNDGGWEAGVDGATAGILMWAAPVVGQPYRQELYEGEAEDMAVVVATGVTVTLSDGRVFTNCLQILEWTPLEPGHLEHKYYKAGTGIVYEEPLHGSAPVEALGTFDVSLNSLPDFGAATFTNPTQITNPYLPFAPGTTTRFEADTEDGLEVIIIDVLTTTRIVNGVVCAVVRDRVFVDDVLVEDTHDWYAQDDNGNVWYMGEEVINFEFDEDGNPTGTNSDGSWESGVDGAEPGIVMWAAPPSVGMSYRQEFYEDEAEDMAIVVATGLTVTLSDGTTYQNCWQTLEWTVLEGYALEHKFYAPGVGLILEKAIGSDETVELVTTP